jgi:hypothetical protein
LAQKSALSRIKIIKGIMKNIVMADHKDDPSGTSVFFGGLGL